MTPAIENLGAAEEWLEKGERGRGRGPDCCSSWSGGDSDASFPSEAHNVTVHFFIVYCYKFKALSILRRLDFT